MKISFSKTVLKSIKTLQKNLKFFSTLVILFLFGNLLLIVVARVVEQPSFLLAIILRLIELALYVKLAVTVHRSVILNEVWQWKNIFSWHKNETLFFSMILVIGIAAVVAMTIIFYLISLIFGDSTDGNELVFVILFITLGGAVFAKICLIFPSTAIDNEMAIEESIKVTQGAFLTLFALTTVIPFLTGIISALLLSKNQVWLNIISGFIFNLVVVFQISILSHVYQQLTEYEPDKADKISAEQVL